MTEVGDVEARAAALLADGVEPSRLVVVTEHPDYPGNLRFEPLDAGSAGGFYAAHSEWLSRHLVLNGLHLAESFTEALEADGQHVLWTASASRVRADVARWSEPLEVVGYSLRPFQSFALRRALERASTGADGPGRFWFWNWSAGAGKSYCSGAGARVLLDSGVVDLVVACTLARLKENLRRTYTDVAGLDAVVNDGTRDRRSAVYAAGGHRVWVMNYEKLWADEAGLAALTAGRRVLWVLDEAHKVIGGDEGQNRARKALDRLVAGCEATVWPMSATVVGGNPLRYRDVFSLDGEPSRNPLSTKSDFVDRYAQGVSHVPVLTPGGRQYSFTAYDWDLHALHDVRHRVGDRTMAVRKTDPGVRDQFRGMQTVPVMVQPTPQTRALLDGVTALARDARSRGEGLAPWYVISRVACVNPEALLRSTSPQAAIVAAEMPGLLSAEHSAKIRVLNDMLESIQQAQDKTVVFCHWTELGLLTLAPHVTVTHVLHHGGQTTEDSQRAQDRFKADPSVTAFLSSDAGTHGLNLQEARYVINVDPVYSYDDLVQRNSRIDRADSHLDGLTAYVLITEGSVEERVWRVCEERRQLASAVQGTQERLSYGEDGPRPASRPESANLDWLMFGD